MDVFNVSSDSMFVVSSAGNAQKEQYARQYLEKGLQAYVDKDYSKAIQQFKQAIGVAPQSEMALNAYEYTAKAQAVLGDTEGAINSYKAMSRLAPMMDTAHTSLANLYYANDRFDEAALEYEQAVRLNPSPANRYSLGQGYLATGNYDAALAQFNMVQQQASSEPQGSFGIGQTYAKMGLYDQAISSFKNAIAIQGDYWEAYAEMGYALADSGDFEQAKLVADELEVNSSDLASLLTDYIDAKANPKMVASYPSDLFAIFLSTGSAGTNLADMDIDLAAPDSEKVFAMKIMFSKEMDRSSVENELNWDITRAVGTGLGDGYNYSLPVPDTEASIASKPIGVIYDPSTLSATVLFTLKQNSTATATIDPAHINFTFKGVDTYGITMDAQADTYSGFSGFA